MNYEGTIEENSCFSPGWGWRIQRGRGWWIRTANKEQISNLTAFRIRLKQLHDHPCVGKRQQLMFTKNPCFIPGRRWRIWGGRGKLLRAAKSKQIISTAASRETCVKHMHAQVTVSAWQLMLGFTKRKLPASHLGGGGGFDEGGGRGGGGLGLQIYTKSSI